MLQILDLLNKKLRKLTRTSSSAWAMHVGLIKCHCNEKPSYDDIARRINYRYSLRKLLLVSLSLYLQKVKIIILEFFFEDVQRGLTF